MKCPYKTYGSILEHWESMKMELLQGTYEPQPVRRVEIPKPDGGVRLLGIPTVIDRFIQQAIAQVLTTLYDPTFSDQSYGFRPNRSAHDAVRKAKGYIQGRKSLGSRYRLGEILRQSEP